MSQDWNLCNFHLAWGFRSTHLERLRTCDVAPKLRGYVDLQPASVLRPWSLKTVEHVVPDLWNISAGWSMLFPSGSMVHAGAYDQKFGCLSESIHIGTVVNMTVDASLDEILLYRLNGANGAEQILACVLLTLPFSFCLRSAVIFWWKQWATPQVWWKCLFDPHVLGFRFSGSPQWVGSYLSGTAQIMKFGSRTFALDDPEVSAWSCRGIGSFKVVCLPSVVHDKMITVGNGDEGLKHQRRPLHLDPKIIEVQGYLYIYIYTHFTMYQTYLVGGLEHVLHILGIIMPTDFHIFQRARSTTHP